MPVSEFTGKLDTPTVQEFTGTLDAPTTPSWPPPPPTASIGPAPDDPNAQQRMYQQVRDEVAAGDQQIPFLQRESFHDKSIPVLGAMASLLVPGSGFGAIGLQSLLAGLGSGAGELVRQQQTREPTDIGAAAKTGAINTVTTAGAGLVAKGLGAIAKRLFSTPLSPEQEVGAQFARDNQVPFPLSSAAPASGAGNVQQATRALLLGDIKTQADANTVTQFLNNHIGQITQKAEVFDDTARAGQQFLRQVFEPGETAVKNAFSDFTEAVGADTPIPATSTMTAVKNAADQLAKRGQTTGGLYQRLRTIIKANPQSYTPKELDELYGAVIRQAFKSGANAGAEGDMLLKGIVADMDSVGKNFGINFADNISNAAAVREQFRALRNIPQLQRLAEDIGSGRDATRGTIDWMNTLFSSENGKALSKLRELNPSLYHDLADAWLSKQIQNASGLSGSGLGRVVDGNKLRSWFEANQGKITEIFGAPQAKALDNFSTYAKYMTGAVQRSTQGSTFNPMNLFPRIAGEAATLPYKPEIVLAGEPAAFVLARGLADPNSALFRVFTKGFSPATRSFAVKSAELSGQSIANGKNTR